MPSMPAENLYEYAVLRYVPRVEREEFVNIGLAMICKRRRWMRLDVLLDDGRLDIFGKGSIPCDVLRRQIKAFEDIAAGHPEAGPIAQYPVEERFRWITAEKSACIRTSRPHPGVTDDLQATFDRLFKELVE